MGLKRKRRERESPCCLVLWDEEAMLRPSTAHGRNLARGTLFTGEEGIVKQLRNRTRRLCPSSQSPYSLMLADTVAAAVMMMGGRERREERRAKEVYAREECRERSAAVVVGRTEEQALFCCRLHAMEETSDHGTAGKEGEVKRHALPLFLSLASSPHTLISLLPLTSPLLATPFRSRNHATSLTLENKGSSDDLGSFSFLILCLILSFIVLLVCLFFAVAVLRFDYFLFPPKSSLPSERTLHLPYNPSEHRVVADGSNLVLGRPIRTWRSSTLGRETEEPIVYRVRASVLRCSLPKGVVV